MNAKKYAALIMAAVLSLCLCACGVKEPQSAEPSSQTTEETAEKAAESESRESLAGNEPADDFSGGTGTSDDPYQIATAQELARMRYVLSEEYYDEHFEEWSAYRSAFYVLTADIALNDTASYDTWSEAAPACVWKPICDASNGFAGCFDGQGHTISGMYIRNDEEAGGAGLFARLYNGAVIKNITFENAFISSGNAQYAGVLAGEIYCTDEAVAIEGISAEGTIIDEASGLEYAGGIAGKADGLCTLSGCSFTGTIRASKYIGGIVGSACCTGIVNCSAEGAICSGDDAYCGGIVGRLSPGEGGTTVSGCVNRMDLTETQSGSDMGGIAGTAILEKWSTLADWGWVYGDDDILVEDCSNEAAVGSGENDCGGGILGNVSSFNSGESDITVSGCVNHGEIRAAEYAGGIISDIRAENEGGTAVKDCANTGDVSARYAGGIVGYFTPGAVSCSFENCRNEGRTEAGVSAGGILGQLLMFSLSVDHADMQPLYIRGCLNDGEVLTTEGITGVGGIVGSISSVTEAFTYLVIEDCANTHELYALQSGRVGGILGSAALALLSEDAETDTPLYIIRNCASTADILVRDAKGAVSEEGSYASEEESEQAREVEAEAAEALENEAEANNAAWLILGGNTLGGIAGYHKYGMIEGCVFSGEIKYDGNVTLMNDAGALKSAASDPDETGNHVLISGGGICGTYFYLDTCECTAENTGILDCVYNEAVSAPYAAFFDIGGSVSGVEAVTAEEAAERAAAVTEALR